MLQRLNRIYSNIKQRFQKKPLSLAEKCRLQFGGAVLFSLILALLIPYFWMNKLTGKSALDAGRYLGQVVYENHFKLNTFQDQTFPRLTESGTVLSETDYVLEWIRLDADAKSSGVFLALFLMLILAPFSIRSFAFSPLHACMAAWRGVLPSLSLALILAPASIKRVITAALFQVRHAWWSGVRPDRFLAPNLAPCSRRRAATSS